MKHLKSRLAHYALVAGALPIGAASGAIVSSGPGPIGTATPGSPLLVDFGPGIGEVFRFEVATTQGHFSSVGFSTSTYSGGTTFIKGLVIDRQISNALFQFNPANTGGVVNPGFLGFATGNDPARLATGAPISTGQAFYGPMTAALSSAHDLAYTFTAVGAYTTGDPINILRAYGDWRGGNRGYIGFDVEVGGADTFGWIDVEWLPGDPLRASPQLIIHGWAYNDTPRGPITAGEIPAPAVGGLVALAFGAAGLRRSRRSPE